MWTANSHASRAAVHPEAVALAEAGGSLFLRLARFCAEQTLTLQELRALLGPVWLKRSCFELSMDAGARLRQAMGVSEQAWHAAQARELLPHGRARVLIVSALRYCPRCLAYGWHSGLFQHAAVRSCPQHQLPLLMGCPHCGVPIDAWPITVAEHHLYCPTCGRALSDALGAPAQVDVAKFAALRAALRPPARRSLFVWPTGTRWHDLLDSPAHYNAAAGHYAWNRGTVTGLRHFRHMRVPFPTRCWEESMPARRSMFIATLAALQWIRECIVSECGWHAWITCERGVRQLPYAVKEHELSVAVLAFWQLTAALRMPAKLEVPVAFHRAWDYPVDLWLPDRIELLCPAIEAHVLIMYAANLLRARRYCRASEAPWGAPTDLDVARLIPSWWIEEREGVAATWVLRPRIDRAGVQRLVRRYAHARFSEG